MDIVMSKNGFKYAAFKFSDLQIDILYYIRFNNIYVDISPNHKTFKTQV